jgi:hypothetical protein
VLCAAFRKHYVKFSFERRDSQVTKIKFVNPIKVPRLLGILEADDIQMDVFVKNT